LKQKAISKQSRGSISDQPPTKKSRNEYITAEAEFLQSFFDNDKATQQQIMNALMTDQRMQSSLLTLALMMATPPTAQSNNNNRIPVPPTNLQPLNDEREQFRLPAHEEVALAINSVNTPTSAAQTMSYNNQIIDNSNCLLYHPLDHTSFYSYPLNILNDIHRSMDPSNIAAPKFNLVAASHKSCLHYATQINDFVNGLILTDDQC